MTTLQFSLGQLAERLGATLRGAPETVVRGLASLQDAGPDQLSFLATAQYRKHLRQERIGIRDKGPPKPNDEVLPRCIDPFGKITHILIVYHWSTLHHQDI